MRTIPFLAALAILLAPALASAQVKPYIEGQIGLLTSIGDSELKNTDTDEDDPSDLMYDLENDSDISFGAEIGVGEIAGTGFRVGLSYSQFGSDMSRTNPSGTVAKTDASGNIEIVDGNVVTQTHAEARAFEVANAAEGDDTPHQDRENKVEFDVTVNVLSLNIYHDFDIGSPMTPYVGLGIGQGTIEAGDDDEDGMVVSLHAGANYDINENFYVGARASFHQVGGPTFESGTRKSEIDDFNIWTLGIVGGVRF